jgi:hypothetical protein
MNGQTNEPENVHRMNSMGGNRTDALLTVCKQALIKVDFAVQKKGRKLTFGRRGNEKTNRTRPSSESELIPAI